jgi:hypothetical protein
MRSRSLRVVSSYLRQNSLSRFVRLFFLFFAIVLTSLDVGNQPCEQSSDVEERLEEYLPVFVSTPGRPDKAPPPAFDRDAAGTRPWPATLEHTTSSDAEEES